MNRKRKVVAYLDELEGEIGKCTSKVDHVDNPYTFTLIPHGSVSKDDLTV